MKETIDINNISPEKFTFVSAEGRLHDKGLETKPVGYLRDAWNRFKKNKGSVFAAIIIGLLVLFSIFAPLVSQYEIKDQDMTFAFCYPKSSLSDKTGVDFWDGCVVKEHSINQFLYNYAIGVETGHSAVKNQKYTVKTSNEGEELFKYRFDTYRKQGVVYMTLQIEDYERLQKYQDETGIQVIYPITTLSARPTASQDKADANFWYKTKTQGGKTVPVYTQDEEGNYVFENIYKEYSALNEDGDPYDGYHSTVFYGEGETAENRLYDYGRAVQNGTQYEIRVDYYEYYIYNHTYVLKDGIKQPLFIFGTTASGKDILTCLGGGARLSFLLAIAVSLVNLIVGTIYGAIEGYYGGAADMIMERFAEILSAVPFMIVITLLKMHMKGSSQLLILFIAFFLTGWISAAGRTRMQFYRFKNQEYVMAARTLGASDLRVMFKHIFPNSLGTLITSTVLVIPGMIFSESSLSYLGIINLEAGSLTSVGTMLSAADPYLSSYPYMMIFPAVFISLLMLSFNLFGNGLRDAFNPSLRGTEE